MTNTTAQAIAKLTPMGRSFMTQVGNRKFDFFDGGIVEGEGNWGENMAAQMACAKSARSAGGIMAGTLKLGLWTTMLDTDTDQNWWSLTELGAEVANELAATKAAVEEQATKTGAELFAKMIQSWDIDRLLDYYGMCVQDNSFGRRDEEIEIVRAEIKSRMS